MDGDLGTGGEGKLFLDFGEVSMFGYAVGSDTLVAFAEEIIDFGFAASAADAAERIGDDSGGFDDSSAEQRQGGEQDAGGVTTWGSDEACGADGVAMDFGHAVDRFGEESGGGVIVSVELLVGGGALEAKVGAEIDDGAPGVEQGDCEFGGDAVGEGQEDDFSLCGEDAGIGVAEFERTRPGVAGEFGEDLSRLTYEAVRE